MNRDSSSLVGFFKLVLNRLCVLENNRCYTEKEARMLKQLEEVISKNNGLQENNIILNEMNKNNLDTSRAFKLIMDKKVDITKLIYSFECEKIGDDGLLIYNTHANIRSDHKLVQCEYELLKTAFIINNREN